MTTKTTDAVPPRIDVEPVNSARTRQALYAARRKIFPKRAQGTFRRLKWIVMAITLTIYYVTPWLRWDRGEYAPDQAVLLDLANRRFYFFFLEIWPQEFYYVAGLLVMAGVGLFLVTSTVGRACAATPAPRPSGSTSSSLSNAPSKATAMRASSSRTRPGPLAS